MQQQWDKGYAKYLLADLPWYHPKWWRLIKENEPQYDREDYCIYYGGRPLFFHKKEDRDKVWNKLLKNPGEWIIGTSKERSRETVAKHAWRVDFDLQSNVKHYN